MKNIIIILVLVSVSCHSQTKEETEIFNEIVDHEISNGGLYVQCDKSKTYFDSTDFKEKTGLEVPENILRDLTEASNKSKDSDWDSELIRNLKYGSDFIKSNSCLTKKDVEALFKQTGKRQSVLSISDPIFDSKFEHCIVSITYWKFTGSAYGQTYFLKKVYGLWTIISTYDIWIT